MKKLIEYSIETGVVVSACNWQAQHLPSENPQDGNAFDIIEPYDFEHAKYIGGQVSEDSETKLNTLRKKISDEMSNKTKELIFDFEYIGYSFDMTVTRQLNMFDMYSVKNDISYTFDFKIGKDQNGKPVYFPINSVLDFDALVDAFRNHKLIQLESGNQLAETLAGMTEEELNNFVDER